MDSRYSINSKSNSLNWNRSGSSKKMTHIPELSKQKKQQQHQKSIHLENWFLLLISNLNFNSVSKCLHQGVVVFLNLFLSYWSETVLPFMVLSRMPRTALSPSKWHLSTPVSSTRIKTVNGQYNDSALLPYLQAVQSIESFWTDPAWKRKSCVSTLNAVLSSLYDLHAHNSVSVSVTADTEGKRSAY